MLIIRPHIFNEFPEIICAFSTRSAWEYSPPYCFNLSLSVGDDRERVLNNRNIFFNSLGLSPERAALQKQVHADGITVVSAPGHIGGSDAMITDKSDVALCISTADCTAVFIYDRKRKIIAAVHSGWRGTQKGITGKTIRKLISEFNCNPDDLTAYIGPSIHQVNYEIGPEVAELFDTRYLLKHSNRFFLDVAAINYDMLIDEGIPSNKIQKSFLCSYEYAALLHSYRRDGKRSGRALGIIAMRKSK